jgi:hypothetical protein
MSHPEISVSEAVVSGIQKSAEAFSAGRSSFLEVKPDSRLLTHGQSKDIRVALSVASLLKALGGIAKYGEPGNPEIGRLEMTWLECREYPPVIVVRPDGMHGTVHMTIPDRTKPDLVQVYTTYQDAPAADGPSVRFDSSGHIVSVRLPGQTGYDSPAASLLSQPDGKASFLVGRPLGPVADPEPLFTILLDGYTLLAPGFAAVSAINICKG